TFGLSVPTIVLLSAVCLTLFLVNCGVLVLLVRLGKPSQYNPNIFDMLSALPMSPSLMLGLCLGFLSLLKTRCRADRIGILLVLAGFGLLWVLIRMPLSLKVNELLFGFKDLTIMEPWVSVVTGLLVIWGLSLFLWTRNQWIGLLPSVVSIAVSIWSPALWVLVQHGSNIFFSFPFLFISVAVRCIPIAFLLFTFKVIDKYSIMGKSSTAS
ncbi:MAG: hypothetical protein ACYCVB_09815, partial [Bacilli bacterium]